MAEKSEATRAKVLTLAQDVQSPLKPPEIAGQLNMKPASVRSIIRRYGASGDVQSRPRSGRPPKIPPDTVDRLVRSVERDPKQTTTALTDITHSSLNTVSRRLREKGYNSRIARTKPYLSEDNIEARILWASNNRETDWETVMFTHESTFMIGETGKERVIRKKGTEWELSHLAVKLRRGGNVCV